MDDYISREAALKFRLTASLRPEKLTAAQAVVDAIVAYIQTIPAADVVARDCFDRLLAENDRLRQERPVVRCRDCKHYDCEDGDQKCVKDAEWDEEAACYYGFISYHGPEFYCADGERKDGGQDDGY